MRRSRPSLSKPCSVLPFIAAVLVASVFSSSGDAVAEGNGEGRLAFVGGRILDGRGGAPVENGVLLVERGRIEAVGPGSEIEVPPGSRVVDVEGKTLVPGFVNAHGHVGGTRGLSQARENYTRENILEQLALYARYGVTTVFSLGGDGPEGVRIRDEQETEELARARLFVAGPVVNGATPEEARDQVREVVGMGADLVKIRVDDFLGRVPKMSPEVYEAVIDEAHGAGLEVAVHLYYLEDAKRILRAGGDFIAHSVRDAKIDDELLALLEETGVCVCPTLTRELSTFVYASTPDFFSDPFFLREASERVLDELQQPERQTRVRENRATAVYREALETAQANLAILSDAGIPIAFGTDSGPPARFQGYFEHLEMELMAEAGLEPMEILVAATRDAARCLGHDDEIGTLQEGRWADLVVLEDNPLDEIRNTRTIHSVWIAGNRVPGAGTSQP